MSSWVDAVRWLHVIGSAVLLGTGAGIAFFMLDAHRTRDPALIAHVASTVVKADFVFTATAVILQPITGAILANALGWAFTETWVALSILLYVLTGLCWLPVIAIQVKLRDIASEAARDGHGLPPSYYRLFRRWLILGFPAFTSVLVILWLMITRPAS